MLISESTTNTLENDSDGANRETEDEAPLDVNENSGVTSKIENDDELLI